MWLSSRAWPAVSAWRGARARTSSSAPWGRCSAGSSWAVLIYVLGTKVFAQPQTRSDVGELLRTTGFAAAPGVLRVLGIVPGLLGDLLLLVVAIWMLVAMVVAVRQALDFTTTWRAVVVCVAGWGVMLVLIAVSGGFMSPVGQ